jgi:protein-S-isoprenylcysteine O-methyltransferase Ste14
VFTLLYLLLAAVFFIEGRRTVLIGRGKAERIMESCHTFVPLASYVAIAVFGVIEYFIIKRKIDLTVSFLGSLVFVIGITLRNFAIRTLGNSWSIHVWADGTKEIVRRGPYRYFRHPYYLGSLLSLSGILSIANSYCAIILIVLVQLPLYLMRMRLEEECLLEKFGEEYIVYKKGVWI